MFYITHVYLPWRGGVSDQPKDAGDEGVQFGSLKEIHSSFVHPWKEQNGLSVSGDFGFPFFVSGVSAMARNSTGLKKKKKNVV